MARLRAEGAQPRPKATPLSRPAPTLKDAPPRTKKPANPRRMLTSRQHRLDEKYGASYLAKTGEDLASNAGLMRALIEQNVASAADMRSVMRQPVVGDLQRHRRMLGSDQSSDSSVLGPSANQGRSTFATSPVMTLDFARRIALQVKLPPVDSFAEDAAPTREAVPRDDRTANAHLQATREAAAETRLGVARAARMERAKTSQGALDLAYNVLGELGKQGVTADTRDAVVSEIAKRHPDWNQALQIASRQHLAVEDPVRTSQLARGTGSAQATNDITNAILVASGIGGAGKVLASASLKIAGRAAAKEAAAKALSDVGLEAAPRTIGTFGRAAPGVTGRAVLRSGRAVLQPAKTLQRAAARGPARRVAAGSAVLALPAAAATLAAHSKGLRPPPLPFPEIDNFGIAEAAYAAGGELPPNVKADIRRRLGEKGHLIASTYARDKLLAAAKKHGWDDTEHTDDLTLIEHSMLQAESGARRFVGNAFQDIAVMSDIPGGVQAGVAAARQATHEGSGRPLLKFAQEGFVDPVAYALQHPIESATRDPLLTATILHGAARTGGALGGRLVPKGREGVRSVRFPGQGDVVTGPVPHNLVDRAGAAVHDAILNRANPEGNLAARTAHRRIVSIQGQQGKGIITRAQHRADVAAQQLTHKAQKAVAKMHPAVAEAFNMVVQYATDAERANPVAFFDHFINGMTRGIANTEARIEKLPVGSPRRQGLEADVLPSQRAALEGYKNMRDVWRRHDPKGVLVAEATRAFGEADKANRADIVRETGGDAELAQNLATRAHADYQAFDVVLEQADRAERRAALTLVRKQRKAHTENTTQARAAVAQAQARHNEALAALDNIRTTYNEAPRKVEAAAPIVDVAAALQRRGIVTNAEQLQRALDLNRSPIARRSRKLKNAERVATANNYIGEDIVTAGDEHGVVTGAGDTGSRSYFQVSVIAKDGSLAPRQMNQGEVRSAKLKFDRITGQTMNTGASERAGFSKPISENVNAFGDNQAGYRGAVYDEPQQTGPVHYLTKPKHGDNIRIGVASLGNSIGYGARRGPGHNQHYHVVIRLSDGNVDTIPHAHFSDSDSARRFARELDQRLADHPESDAFTEADAILGEQQARLAAPEADPFAATPEPDSTTVLEPAAPEAPAARFTPARLKAANAKAARARAEAARLRDAGSRQSKTAEPVPVKIPAVIVDKILERGKASAELERALKGAESVGKLGRSLDVPPALISELRIELRRTKVAAASNLADKLPHPGAGIRASKAGEQNLERAVALERRADTIDRRVAEFEGARRELARIEAGKSASAARGAQLEKAQARVDATAVELERVTADEKAASAVPEPVRPDTQAITRRLRAENAAAREAAGATPAFRPHVRPEEGPGSGFPLGGSNRALRSEFRDVLGKSRLERNTLQNVREGRTKPDVSLTLRAMRAVVQARELSHGAVTLAETWGTKLKVRPGAKIGPGAVVDQQRLRGDLYAKIDEGHGSKADAEELFNGVFQVVGDAERIFERRFPKDQIVVKTGPDSYYLMPAEAVAQLRTWFANTMEKFHQRGALTAITKAWRTQALNTTPTTPVNNFLGNVVLAATGGAGPLSMIRAARTMSGKGRFAGSVPLEEGTSGMTGAMTPAMRPGYGILGGRNPAARAARVYINGIRGANIMAEDFGRFSLWIKEATKDAKRQQYGPIMSKMRRANEETARMIRNGEIDFEKIHRTVNDFFGDLYKRGKYDRAIFLASPFHRWFRHMVKLALVTMPLKYPKRAAFLQLLGGVGEDYRNEHGVYPEWMRGVLLTTTELVGPFTGNADPTDDNLVQHGFSTSGWNPYATPTQFLGGGVGGGASPVLVTLISLLTGQHFEDFGNIANDVYGTHGAVIRPLKDWQGNAINRGSEDWLKVGAHQIMGWVPLINKAFPSSGQSDAYIPGLDDNLPGIGRLYEDQSRTYKPPSVLHLPAGTTLPPWLEPAQADRGWQAGLMRFWGARQTPFNVGGPAFQLSAQKAIENATRDAGNQLAQKIGAVRTPDPKAP